MTFAGLVDSVGALGLDTTLTDVFGSGGSRDARFISTVNRGISRVSALRPRTGIHTICHTPRTPVRGVELAVLRGARAYEVPLYGADGVAFSLEGTGSFTLSGVKHDFSHERAEVYRFLLDREGYLVFDAGCQATVRGLGLYEGPFSDAREVPLYERFLRYDLAAEVPDFHSLPPAAVRRDGEITLGFHLEGGHVLCLPCNRPGIYTVTYRCAPQVLDTDVSDEQPLLLDEDLAQLLPLLVGAYVLMDEDFTKSQYLLALYREGAGQLYDRRDLISPLRWESVNGWG